MNSLADVFRILNEMRVERVIDDYAIGEALAMLFYAEPTRTYDLDVFVVLPARSSSLALTSLHDVYAWTAARGFLPDAEHVLIHGVPVQFLPSYNPLVQESIKTARNLEYAGVPVRVVGPEHLVALAIQAGGSRRRERAWLLVEQADVDRALLRAVLDRHDLRFDVPDDV